jgi:hypothetical protein
MTTIVTEAHRVATIAARAEGHQLATCADVAATLRRWGYVTSIAQTREELHAMRLVVADSLVESKGAQ